MIDVGMNFKQVKNNILSFEKHENGWNNILTKIK